MIIWRKMNERNKEKNKAGQTTKTQWRRKKTAVMEFCLLPLTHRSPGLNSRENLVLFFLCFLFRLRMESGMLFLRLGPRPPLWEEAVELADDVRELKPGLYSHRLTSHLITHTYTGKCSSHSRTLCEELKSKIPMCTVEIENEVNFLCYYPAYEDIRNVLFSKMTTNIVDLSCRMTIKYFFVPYFICKVGREGTYFCLRAVKYRVYAGRILKLNLIPFKTLLRPF